MPAQDHVIAAYARLAPMYRWLFGRTLEDGRVVMGQEVRRIAPRRLLEIGVGTGLTLHHYPPETEIHGIDVSPQMLAHAELHAGRLNGRTIHLQLMDAEALRFPNAHFDCVTIPYVLSVTSDPNQLIREARRVCRPGGLILVLNHFSEGGFWQRLEVIAQLLGEKVGFRTGFRYDSVIASHDWRVLRNDPVNLLGLSRFVVLKNEAK